MWICLNNAFLSIIEPVKGGDKLRVRARRKGDIEAVFPGAKVERTPGRDYLYRAELPREQVVAAIASQVAGISYPNFKDSVKNKPLHDAYARFWGIMANLQELRPYSTTKRRGQGAFL
ncbi:hypothetical protein FHR70_000723 [Microvirga lupini]|uniref:Uncharacterized protein n=1 Tax=Microvirga lupini TaxID=420324 RepID=A0A7W4VI81_9HYPH|nr:hypothetical protein [Microvirga lupini]MBB3017683.1 hypothetical protein [Microvirga lupini]